MYCVASIAQVLTAVRIGYTNREVNESQGTTLEFLAYGKKNSATVSVRNMGVVQRDGSVAGGPD